MLNELFILAKIKEGDIKAFEEIFRCYYSPLCWYAAGITGEVEAAEEIVEELFYVFWKDREHLQIFQSIKSYLYRAMKRFNTASIEKSENGIGSMCWQIMFQNRCLILTGSWSMRSCRRLSAIHLINCRGADSGYLKCIVWKERNM
jgi:hypothetical protein